MGSTRQHMKEWGSEERRRENVSLVDRVLSPHWECASKYGEWSNLSKSMAMGLHMVYLVN